MKKILFIDRDGTLIEEPKDNFQVDSIEKLVFYPKLLSNLSKIAEQLDYELVLVTNQDGLGTASFPEEDFWPAQKMMLQILKSEGIEFREICIDRSFPHEKSPNRKPGTGMLTKYFSKEYDLSQSYVIGDRWTDVELAKNLGAKAILIHAEISLGEDELGEKKSALESVVSLKTSQWNEIYDFLNRKERVFTHRRTTRETDVRIKLNLDGQGEAKITTGIPFFDHMLEQIPRHSGMDLEIQTIGDLEIDEHHSIEDTALSLGEAIAKAIQDKRGMNRYGFCLPMDDCLAQVALDLGGRPYLVWNAEFKREMIGKMPCEMFYHFFKSFSDGAKCNLNIKAEGKNEHHKIEGIFKAFARSLGMAVERNKEKNVLPSTKGVL